MTIEFKNMKIHLILLLALTQVGILSGEEPKNELPATGKTKDPKGTTESSDDKSNALEKKRDLVRVTIVGQVDTPKNVEITSDSSPIKLLNSVELTEFASKDWFFVVRFYNVRPKGSTRVVRNRQEIDRVYFQPLDTLESLGIKSGSIIVIPSKW
jgi:hypothetical protein